MFARPTGEVRCLMLPEMCRGDAGEAGMMDRPAASADEALLAFLDAAPIALIRFRSDGKIDLSNVEAARLLAPFSAGADASDLYALLTRAAPDLPRRVASFRAPFGQVCDRLRLSVPGAPTILALTIKKIDQDNLMAVVQDITEAEALRASRLRAQQKLDVLCEHVEHHAVYRVGLDGCITGWNSSLRRIGGWEQGDVVMAPLSIMLAPEQVGPGQIAALFDQARRRGTATLDCWHVRKDGSRFWGSTVITPMPDGEGNADGFVLVTRDLSDQLHLTEMHELAATDDLTGALNRRAGMDRLEAAFDVWRQLNQPFSILSVDIDYFKRVNDTWGHGCGDSVLVSTVGVLRGRLRERDCVIRWGGEEFLLLLPDTWLADALLIAERVRAAVAANVVLVGKTQVDVSVSVGVAQVGGSHASLCCVIEGADRAMYGAKDAGRNRVQAGR
jgi:diguanylate cyclase (GGDEF)-like protein/PAS domain S-box-containing protein